MKHLRVQRKRRLEVNGETAQLLLELRRENLEARVATLFLHQAHAIRQANKLLKTSWRENHQIRRKPFLECLCEIRRTLVVLRYVIR